MAWRANCDFRFLVDVDACENYCVKYATKDEKQTESFSKMMKKIVALAKKEGKSVKGCFSSLLIKTIGERDYTAQEVCGQLEQLPYVQYSRTVQKVNLSNMRSLAQKKAAKDDDCNVDDSGDETEMDDEDQGTTAAAAENNVDRYASRPPALENLSLFRYIAELDHQLNPIASCDDYRIPFPVPAYHPHPHGRNHDQYCKNRLMLHKPWRGDAETLRTDGQPWQDALEEFLKYYELPLEDGDDPDFPKFDESKLHSYECTCDRTLPNFERCACDANEYGGNDRHLMALFREYHHWRRRGAKDKERDDERAKQAAEADRENSDETDSEAEAEERAKKRRRNVPGAANLIHTAGVDFNLFEDDDDDIEDFDDDQAEVDWSEDARALGDSFTELDCSPGRVGDWLSKQRWMPRSSHGDDDNVERASPQQILQRRQRLKGKQRLAFMIVKQWVDDVAAAIERDGHSRSVKPLRLLIKGTAGTGKSFVIERIHEYVNEVAQRHGWPAAEEAAQVAAYTGVAAFNVKGRTLHSIFSLPTDPDDFDDLKATTLDKLQRRLEHTKLLILDERSMIGRRTFSWLSERAKQGKMNSDVSFGGLGVIQLGDDAQLPPIGDLPLYTRHVPKSCDGYARAGVGLVDEFIPDGDHESGDVRAAVVVLDVLMRQQGTDKAQVRFKEALTHLRDGCWGATKDEADRAMARDYSLFVTRRFNNLPADEAATFESALRLYATNDKVNKHNRRQLRKVKKRCTIHSVNSGPGANDASADKAGGLQRKVYLGIGARVMLTSNLWTTKGLVNGSVGNVKAICFGGTDAPPSMPACVVVHFPQYEGPSFREDLYGPRCVPITPLETQWFARDQKAKSPAQCTRIQLPLKLAWAITIHKSQGLTIGHGSPTARKVVIDIGDREMCSGLTFVALSRAKRLDDIAFSFPMFSWRRMSRCAEGKHLQTRKNFEARLDGAGEVTEAKFPVVWPFGEADDDGNHAPEEGAAASPTLPDDDSDLDEDLLSAIMQPKLKQNSWLLSQKQDALRKSLSTPANNSPPQSRASRAAAVASAAGAQMRGETYSANMTVVNRTHPVPSFANRRMRMRIVDFLHGSEAKFDIAAWARRMGFEVTIDHPDREQPSCECGYIAACVMAKLKSAGDGWLTADVDDANDEQWVRRGNDILGLPGGVHWLGEEQTQRCAAVWDPNNDMGVSVLDTFTLGGALGNDGQLRWMAIGSKCALLRRVSEAIQNNETIPHCSPLLFVSNTEDARSSGYHWISVAFSIEDGDAMSV